MTDRDKLEAVALFTFLGIIPAAIIAIALAMGPPEPTPGPTPDPTVYPLIDANPYNSTNPWDRY